MSYHLRETARLGFRRHKIYVRTGVNPVCQPQIKFQLGRDFVRILSGQAAEEVFKSLLAGPQDDQLYIHGQQTPGDVTQQIDAFVSGQPGDHGHHGRLGPLR